MNKSNVMVEDKTPIGVGVKNLTFSELSDYFSEKFQQKYRAKQVFKWLSLGVEDFSEMTDISKKMSSELEKDFYISTLKTVKREVSKDGTIKFLYELWDKSRIETVLMSYNHGKSICISTQVGCNMGCTFCASAVGGKARDLTAGEILDQIIFTQKNEKIKISNVVLMGIGEPLDNYENVIKFLKNVNNENGICIGYRHISLSTCGIIPKIDELSNMNMPVTLSVSLHAPNDEIRNKIMPVSKKYKYADLLSAVKKYISKTKRRVSFEYTLIDGVNDRPEDANELSERLKSFKLCHINLIPVNKSRDKIERTSIKKINNFKNILIKNGINATIRRTLGEDISAACGQLRRMHNS